VSTKANQVRIWTIGHSTRSLDEFVALLRANGITGLADVRTIPRSRRHPHFSRETLNQHLEDQAIHYRHFPVLGGLRKPQPGSINNGWRNMAFRGYADHMQTAEFAAALEELLTFGVTTPAAIMCAEAVWWQCHRMLIADALVARGIDVQHIMSQRGASTLQPHRLTPCARLDPPRVWYPG
jgi:uncharacterized protein (DUF488 family)